MLPNYELLLNGALKQIKCKPFNYNPEYVAKRYDTYDCETISKLRADYILRFISPRTVLDIGYGNGAFLKHCQSIGMNTYGTDISQYPLKYGKFLTMNECFEKEFDLVTAFDSLEHISDWSFLSKLKCLYICVSVPNCLYNQIKEEVDEEAADKWFNNWKHRRPDEHLWHFDVTALAKTMDDFGYNYINHTYVEDAIRKPTGSQPNILTAIFENDNS